MQREHLPIQLSSETAKVIIENMMNPNSTLQKKAFVKESLVIASKINTKEVRITG